MLDPDELRTWVSGWRELLANAAELERFERAATDAGARWVEVLVEAPDATARFQARRADTPWLEAVHELVAGAPADHVERYAARLRELVGERAVRIDAVDGDIDAAYASLLTALEDPAH